MNTLKIQTIATGSSGNCYFLDDGRSKILIEAGIAFKQIQQALNFDTSNLAGCLITHSHQDHCKGVQDFLRRGMKIYMSQGTKDEIGLSDKDIRVIESKKPFELGSWTVLPFDTQHDTAEPLGFVLQSSTGKRVLFATDTYYIKYKFKELTHIMIECNYDQQTLDENLKNGLHRAQYKRIIKSHFGLENLLEFFKANDLSKVEEIHLLHLSDSNSNAERIYTEVARATGKLIYIP